MTAVLKVAALVVVVAGGWAVLATLFTTPLTSGWREGMEAVMRRWTLAVIVLGPSAAVLIGVWVLVARLLWG
jgi:hypothetical protein